MRITFVIASMQAGGAERVASILLNEWAAVGVLVTLVTLGAAPSFYPLDSRITSVPVGLRLDSNSLWQSVTANVKRVRRLRAAIVRSTPDVVVSFVDRTNIRVLAATRFLGLPVVVSERVDPAHYSIGKAWNALRRVTYPLANAVVVQTQGARNYFPTRLQRRIVVIPNPVSPCAGDVSKPQSLGNVIVAMGRLVPQKGFDLLLAAFARLHGEYGEWRLVIYGAGPERSALQEQADRLQIANCVTFAGLVEDVSARLRACDVFVLSSRYEGFPNALCEAMACGLPVVSFDCPSGPREIIREGIDGFLAPPEDVDALAAALSRLMDDADLRAQMGQRAAEITQRFGAERVMQMWDDLLTNVTGKRSEVA